MALSLWTRATTGLLMQRKSNLPYRWLQVFTATILVCSCVPTYGDTLSPSDCDQVTIEGAGTYTIEHSKISGLGVFHALGGMVTHVLIWPSTNDSGDISKIIIMQDVKPQVGLDCKSLPGDIPNSVSCSQSMPELKLRVIVKFDAKVQPPYETRMKNVVNYLTREVLGCRIKKPSQSL